LCSQPAIYEVNHREVGVHTKRRLGASAAPCVSPDIISSDEMRADLETIELALTAAAHRATLFRPPFTRPALQDHRSYHDVFPYGQQKPDPRFACRESAGGGRRQESLRRLTSRDGSPAIRVLVVDQPIANLIRESQMITRFQAMSAGRTKEGKSTLADAIMEHLRRRPLAPEEEAFEKSNDRKEFRVFLENPPDRRLED